MQWGFYKRKGGLDHIVLNAAISLTERPSQPPTGPAGAAPPRRRETHSARSPTLGHVEKGGTVLIVPSQSRPAGVITRDERPFRVDLSGSIVAPRTAALGASSSLRCVRAKVSSANAQRSLRLDGWNWSSCPKADSHGGAGYRPRRVASRSSRYGWSVMPVV